MSDKRFGVMSAKEMRDKYGLVAANRPTIRLDPSRVPENLRHLIPYAELWGVGDDIIREEMRRSAPREAIEELRRVVEAHDDLLDAWLAGPEADSKSPSEEYLAFSCMRMVV